MKKLEIQSFVEVKLKWLLQSSVEIILSFKIKEAVNKYSAHQRVLRT